MLRRLPHQDAKVLPSNSRVRRRRTSSPLQGPPASRPVRGLRTLRIFAGPSVPVRASLHPLSAQPPATSALKHVSEDRRHSRTQSAGHVHRHQKARVGYSLSASVRCGESSALCSTAAGRPGTGHRQSSGAGQPMSGTVPPR